MSATKEPSFRTN